MGARCLVEVGVRARFVAELQVLVVRRELIDIGQLHALPASLVCAAECHHHLDHLWVGQGVVADQQFFQVQRGSQIVFLQVAAHDVEGEQLSAAPIDDRRRDVGAQFAPVVGEAALAPVPLWRSLGYRPLGLLVRFVITPGRSG